MPSKVSDSGAKSVTRAKSCMGRLGKVLIDQDSFGEHFNLSLDGDSQVAQSYMGSLCTIIILCVTVLYTVMKLDVLMAKKDVDVLSAVKELVLTADDKFSYENGFNIAVAFTEYNTKREYELDKKYGGIVINSYSWGTDSEGKSFTDRSEMQTHPCSLEEMGLVDSERTDENIAYFFTPHPNARYFSELYQKKFLCVEKADLEVYGDFA